MIDVDVREAARSWRAEPTEASWRRLEEALVRVGESWARDLRRAGRRLELLRQRLEYRSAARGLPGTAATRGAAREAALGFHRRQSRRAATALRRACEADLDPRGVAWQDADAVPTRIVEGPFSPTRPFPRWLREVARSEWFKTRAARRRPPDLQRCECGHHAHTHRGAFEDEGAFELWPLTCRGGTVAEDPARSALDPCECRRFRGVLTADVRTPRPSGGRQQRRSLFCPTCPHPGHPGGPCRVRRGNVGCACPVGRELSEVAVVDVCAGCPHPSHAGGPCYGDVVGCRCPGGRL